MWKKTREIRCFMNTSKHLGRLQPCTLVYSFLQALGPFHQSIFARISSLTLSLTFLFFNHSVPLFNHSSIFLLKLVKGLLSYFACQEHLASLQVRLGRALTFSTSNINSLCACQEGLLLQDSPQQTITAPAQVFSHFHWGSNKQHHRCERCVPVLVGNTLSCLLSEVTLGQVIIDGTL